MVEYEEDWRELQSEVMEWGPLPHSLQDGLQFVQSVSVGQFAHTIAGYLEFICDNVVTSSGPFENQLCKSRQSIEGKFISWWGRLL